MSAHAFLAPSSAHQWLSCTAAPHACLGVPDQPSPESIEGVHCHLVAGETLQQLVSRRGTVPFTTKDWYRLNHGLTPDVVNQQTYPVEMLDYAQEYVERALGTVRRARAEAKSAVIMVEQRVDISKYVPECFGTSDLMAVGSKTLYVDDLKYGKGVQVWAKENPQLKYYALGAYEEVSMFYDIERVVLRVDQPRLQHDDEWELPLKDLVAWGHEMRPIAERAFKGEDVQFVPSEDNCRFCKIRYTCAARAQYNLELAVDEFMDPGVTLTDAQIAELLPRAKSMEKWAKDIQAYALKQAGAGHEYPGFKLVEGRSNRYIVEPEIARQTLARAGYTEVDKPRELLGVTALTKLMGKKKFEEVMKYHLVKPKGKPTLVPDTDPRPAIPARDFAADDFAGLDTEDESV